jgi:PAS domain S-box-containing protein
MSSASHGENMTDQTAASNEAPRDIAMLRAFFDAIPGRAAFLGPDLRYRFVNGEFAASVGRPEGAIVGSSVDELLGTEIGEAYRAAMARLQAGETVHSRRSTGNGTSVPQVIEEELKPFAPNGVLTGIVAVSRNLAQAQDREHTRSEWLETQSTREAIHSAVIDSALDCIVVVDAGGHVVEFNPAAEATFGYSRAQAIGKTVAQLIVPPELQESHNAGLRRFAEGGSGAVIGRRVELEAMRSDGSRIPVELAITAVGSGPEALFTAHLRDLRPAREARAEIERQREALYQSEKLAALGSLLAGVAHELNNPLSIVIGQAMMLREAAQARVEYDKEFTSFAERGAKIETAANRCARIVKTFLAMARQREAERGRVEIAELTERVLDLLAYGLRTTGIEVTTDIPANLPALWADSDQLHQVLLNLVVNSRQALEAQPTPRRIAITARADEAAKKVILSVSDNGPGVSEKIRNRIFEPFFTTKPQGVGTGIGLAVSRGLIEAHGGSLSLAASQPGEGASFVIELPADAFVASVATDVDDPSCAPPRRERRRRALVVDDEAEIASLLVEILQRQGFDCEYASSGEQAKQSIAASECEFDLILCDIRMPNGDGPAFYDWLAIERPQMTGRIAFVTGDVLGPAADRFIARSGCPVIEKPFLPDDIRQITALLSDDGE